MDSEWHRTLRLIADRGREVRPRGQRVLEVDHHAVKVDMRYPVLRCPARKLNYRFMAAEALWILDGSDKLEPLVRYNPNMAAFSDDGVTLAGAYGPRILAQMPYVTRKLREDRDTRQATLTLWTPDPVPSKDVPCTVAMDFKVRDDRLNLHVFMRSSDAWLGLPYDVFSFSCVAYLVCAILGDVMPGMLYLTAASSHLYERHWEEAAALGDPLDDACPLVPDAYWALAPLNLRASLAVLRDSRKGDVCRWWEK